MSRKVSLKDIAKEVGVSTALVSYVLNNLKEGRIRKEVAERIRDVARKLNYRPNQIAKSLKTRKTFTIGLVLADISNPFSSTLARIVEEEANKLNYTVIFASSDENPEKFSRLIDMFLNRQVDGLLLSPPAYTEDALRGLIRQEIPFVLLDRFFPDIETSYVVLDNKAAAKRATAHILESGCFNPYMISYDSPLEHLVHRALGFTEGLLEHGMVAVDTHVKKVGIMNDPDEIANALRGILQEPRPEGLLFGSNIIAAQCLKLINKLPIKVPDDLKIVCFDETEWLDLFYAPLTYVSQPMQEMGKMATQILIECVNGNRRVQQIKLEGKLVARS